LYQPHRAVSIPEMEISHSLSLQLTKRADAPRGGTKHEARFAVALWH
jgi:hypothetical protein